MTQKKFSSSIARKIEELDRLNGEIQSSLVQIYSKIESLAVDNEPEHVTPVSLKFSPTGQVISSSLLRESGFKAKFDAEVFKSLYDKFNATNQIIEASIGIIRGNAKVAQQHSDQRSTNGLQAVAHNHKIALGEVKRLTQKVIELTNLVNSQRDSLQRKAFQSKLSRESLEMATNTQNSEKMEKILIIDKLRREAERQQDNLDRLETELSTLNKSFLSVHDEKIKLVDKLNLEIEQNLDLKPTASALMEKVVEQDISLKERIETINSLRQTLEAKQIEVESLKRVTNELTEDKYKCVAKINSLREALNDKNDEVLKQKKLVSNSLKLQDEVSALKNKLKHFENKLDLLNREKDATAAEFYAEKSALEAAITKLEDLLTSSKRSVVATRKSENALKSKVGALEADVERLQKELRNTQNEPVLSFLSKKLRSFL